MGKYYAVKSGRNPGVYRSWKDCEKEVKAYSGAQYKSFKTLEEADAYISTGEVKRDLVIPKSENNKNEVKMNKEEAHHEIRNELKQGEAIAYVDGSFRIKDFNFSYGLVLITAEEIIEENGASDDSELASMRNVAGELMGAMRAMEISLDKKIETLWLYYDYMGIEAWAKGDWKTNKKGTKDYKIYYDEVKEKLNVNFCKVKAHSGVIFNELADKLAKDALGL